jgi:CRP/FNR family transcriptional regulator, anaerobic regulatory protein
MSRFSLAARAGDHPPHLVSPCDTCQAREFSACATLTSAEQKSLAAIMRTINVESHRSLFDEADPAEYVYTITAGTVKVYKLLGDGRRQITGFLFAGDFLGLTHNEAYAYSAEALVPTRLCRFSRRRLEALLAEIPHLEQRLLAMASHELAAAQDQMMLLGRKSARERVVSFILMLSDSAKRHGRPGDPVFLAMSRADIADYLGLATETVSRTVTLLKNQGLIQLLDDKRIGLSNMSALREIAEGF